MSENAVDVSREASSAKWAMPPIAFAWLALLVAPVPLLAQYLVTMWGFEQYQYFPVLFLAVGLLIFFRWDRQWHSPNLLSWLLLGSSLAFAAAGSIFWSPWLGCISFVLAVGSWMVSHQASDHQDPFGLIMLWPPTFLLIRLPLNLDLELTSLLQKITSRVSSLILDMVDIPHRLSGNVFELSSGNLFVEEACSGVQSLFSLLFCALLLVAFARRSMLLIPLYAGAALIWAGTMNITRIIAIALGKQWYALELSTGWKHDVLGYLCLAGAIILLVSTDRLLRVLFFALPSEKSDLEKYNPLRYWWNRAFLRASIAGQETELKFAKEAAELKRNSGSTRSTGRWLQFTPATMNRIAYIVVAAGLLIVVPQTGRLIARQMASQVAYREKVVWQPTAELLAPLANEIAVTKYESVRDGNDVQLGQNADIYTSEVLGMAARIAISQPYPEFHDLCDCYTGNGWHLNARIEVDPPKKTKPGTESDEEVWPMISATFVHADGRYGYLLFSCLSQSGIPVPPIQENLSSLLTGRLSEGRASYAGEKVMMTQVWLVSDSPLTPDQLEQLQTAHLHTREVVRSAVRGGNP